MSEKQKVIGIVGSYRKEGIVDKAVTEILSTAAQQGAEVEKIHLMDKHIEFCTNCRTCMQTPGPERGECILIDDMDAILKNIESASSLVIGSPLNFENVTAVTRKFMERCVGYSYWPWELEKPQIRNTDVHKKAVLVSASGAPKRMGKTFKEAMGALTYLASLLGAHSIGRLEVDQVNEENMTLSAKTIKKAGRLGRKLVTRMK